MPVSPCKTGISIGEIDTFIQRILSNHHHLNCSDAIVRTRLSTLEIIQICHAAAHLFENEPMLLEIPLTIEEPITVIGDVHGNFNDLIRILNETGKRRQKLLFLGDYVDRGMHSVDVTLLLFLSKLKWPSRFYLLRGNHETYETNERYSFLKEIVTLYPENADEIHGLFNDVFDVLPVAAIIDEDEALCVHGGISRLLTSRDAIRCIPRPTRGKQMDLLSKLLLTDLLWSDPAEQHSQRKSFAFSRRKVGFTFSKRALRSCLHALNVKRLVRAHQACESGVKEDFDGACLTISSSSHNCPRLLTLEMSKNIYDNGENGMTIAYGVREYEQEDDPDCSDFVRSMGNESSFHQAPPAHNNQPCIRCHGHRPDPSELTTARCLSYDNIFNMAKEYAQECDEFLKLLENAMRSRHPVMTVIEKFAETYMKAVALRNSQNCMDDVDFATTDILRYLTTSSPINLQLPHCDTPQMVPGSPIATIDFMTVTESTIADEMFTSMARWKSSLESNDSTTTLTPPDDFAMMEQAGNEAVNVEEQFLHVWSNEYY